VRSKRRGIIPTPFRSAPVNPKKLGPVADIYILSVSMCFGLFLSFIIYQQTKDATALSNQLLTMQVELNELTIFINETREELLRLQVKKIPQMEEDPTKLDKNVIQFCFKAAGYVLITVVVGFIFCNLLIEHPRFLAQ
jgi:predicted PurR-regulated permease PerM